MNYDTLFAPHLGRTLRAGLVGAGEFGASFLARSGRAQSLVVSAVADRDPVRARDAALRAGFGAEQVRVCATRTQAFDAHAAGMLVIVEDADLLVQLPLDFVVEATGEPESASRVALAALGEGRHVAMVTKEADCVAGPILQARAAAAGLICTAVDGDQPSLMVALVSWARTLGLEIACAGKSGEYDFVLDPATDTITSTQDGRSVHAPDFTARRWSAPEHALAACVAARASALASFPRATPPDLCELTIVANATGLRPDAPALHAPIARTLELPQLFRPREHGGLLGAHGRLDMFVCLRRPDELSFAGGVFVVVRCDDRATWQVLHGKGIPVSDDGNYALLHNPVHLLGIEAPISVIGAGLLRAPAMALNPVCDLAARTVRDIRAGHVFGIGVRHAIADIEPVMLDAAPVHDDAPLPFYMLPGCRLTADVPAGAVITRARVEPPPDSTLWRLRAEQDMRFFGRARPGHA